MTSFLGPHTLSAPPYCGSNCKAQVLAVSALWAFWVSHSIKCQATWGFTLIPAKRCLHAFAGMTPSLRRSAMWGCQ